MSVRLPPALLREIEKRVEATGLTTSDVIRALLYKSLGIERGPRVCALCGGRHYVENCPFRDDEAT